MTVALETGDSLGATVTPQEQEGEGAPRDQYSATAQASRTVPGAHFGHPRWMGSDGAGSS